MRKRTQEAAETAYALWQMQLTKIRESYHFAKPIESIVGEIAQYPDSGASPSSNLMSMPNGEQVDIGHYASIEEAQASVKRYLDNQV